MKLMVLISVYLFSLTSFCHEGHGEMPTGPAKFGGMLGNVVLETKGHDHKGHDHRPLLKAEIVRSEDGTVRLYIYDLKMNQLKTDTFTSQASATVDNRRARTKDKFVLKAMGEHFQGTMPKQKKRPFDIYVTLTRGKEQLFVAFDNLD